MKKKGLTLIELIITLALVGIISTLVYSSFSNSNKFFSQVNEKLDVQHDGDMLIRRIDSDIIDAISLTTDISGSELIVEKKGNVKNTYALSGNVLKVNNSVVIANNIKAISFKSTEGRTVQIDFKIETNKVYSNFNTILTIRNWRDSSD
jgi:prepilin-type N-terminal cleavage/methylation domain-containing protein